MTSLKSLWTTINSDKRDNPSYPVLNTGIEKLNSFLQYDGIPKHKIIEFVGDIDTFKTFLALKISSNLTNKNKIVFYISIDYDISYEFLQFHKINLENFYILRANYENIIDIIKEISLYSDLIIIDSIASLEYKNAINLLNMISNLSLKLDVSYIVINQFRKNLKDKGDIPYINKFMNQFCSMRIKLSKTGNIVKKYETVGYKVKLNYIKNKIGNAEEETVLKLFFKEC